jgi:hypothetical protein
MDGGSIVSIKHGRSGHLEIKADRLESAGPGIHFVDSFKNAQP